VENDVGTPEAQTTRSLFSIALSAFTPNALLGIDEAQLESLPQTLWESVIQNFAEAPLTLKHLERLQNTWLRQLCLSHAQTGEDHLSEVTRHAASLQSLDITKPASYNLPISTFSYIRELTNLTVLRIDGLPQVFEKKNRKNASDTISVGQWKVSSSISESLGKLTKLRHLHLPSCRLGRNDLKGLAKSCSTLETLDLNGNSGLNTEDIAPIISSNPFLREVGVSDTNIEDLTCFRELENLETLDISWSKISDGDLENLSSLLQLKDLDISKTGVSDTGLLALGCLWKRLTSFNASGCVGVKGEFAEVQGAWLTEGKVTMVEKLVLSQTSFSDLGCQIFLSKFPYLSFLSVAATPISNKGVSAMCSTLRRLEFLDLAGTKVDDECLPRISDLEELSNLCLNDTHILLDNRAMINLVNMKRLSYLRLERMRDMSLHRVERRVRILLAERAEKRGQELSVTLGNSLVSRLSTGNDDRKSGFYHRILIAKRKPTRDQPPLPFTTLESPSIDYPPTLRAESKPKRYSIQALLDMQSDKRLAIASSRRPISLPLIPGITTPSTGIAAGSTWSSLGDVAKEILSKPSPAKKPEIKMVSMVSEASKLKKQSSIPLAGGAWGELRQQLRHSAREVASPRTQDMARKSPEIGIGKLSGASATKKKRKKSKKENKQRDSEKKDSTSNRRNFKKKKSIEKKNISGNGRRFRTQKSVENGISSSNRRSHKEISSENKEKIVQKKDSFDSRISNENVPKKVGNEVSSNDKRRDRRCSSTNRTPKKQRSKKKVEVPTIQGSRSSSRTDKKERKESKQGAVSEPQSRNKSKRNPPKRRWRPIPQ